MKKSLTIITLTLVMMLAISGVVYADYKKTETCPTHENCTKTTEYKYYAGDYHGVNQYCNRGFISSGNEKHTWSTSITAASCTRDGSKTYTCTKCKGSYSETISSRGGHTYRYDEIDGNTHRKFCKYTDSSFVTSGYKKCTFSTTENHTFDGNDCTKCNYSKPVTCSHNYQEKFITNPSCTTTGTKVTACTKCGDEKAGTRITVSALGHNFSAATCTAAQKCSRCGNTVGQALGHEYKWIVKEQASCVRTGLKVKECTRCGNESDSTTIPARSGGHVYKYDEIDALTHRKYCKNISAENANEEYKACTFSTTENHTFDGNDCTKCNYSKPVTCSHDYQEKFITNPSCTTTGIKATMCTKCSDEKAGTRITVPALGHDYSAATCTAPQKCSRCRNTVGQALGHSFEYLPLNATSHKGICSRCDITTTSTHSNVNGVCKICGNCEHNYQWVVKEQASCVRTGLKVKECTKCGNESDSTTIPARSGGHVYKYDEIDALTHRKYCKNISAENANEEYKACTFSTTENHTFDGNDCTKCNYSKPVTCSHSYQVKFITNPSCTTTGIKATICTKCGNEKAGTRVELPALGHDFSATTCTAPQKCSRCGNTVGQPLGHDINYIKFDSVNHKVVCSRGDINTTSPHIMVDNVCKHCGYENKIADPVKEHFNIPSGFGVSEKLVNPTGVTISKWEIVEGKDLAKISSGKLLPNGGAKGTVTVNGLDKNGNIAKIYIVNIYIPQFYFSDGENIGEKIVGEKLVVSNFVNISKIPVVERAKYELISNKANTEHPGDNMQEVSLNQPTKSKIQAQVTYEGKVVLTVWYSIVEDISAGQNITLTDLYFKQKSHSILVGNEEEFTDNYVYLFLENYLVIKPDNALNYRLVYTLEENSELGTINPEGMFQGTGKGSGDVVVRVTDTVSGLTDTCTVKVTTLTINEKVSVPIGANIATKLEADRVYGVKRWNVVSGKECINLEGNVVRVKKEGTAVIEGLNSSGNTTKIYTIDVYRPEVSSNKLEATVGETISLNKILSGVPDSEVDKFTITSDNTNYATSDGKNVTILKANVDENGKKIKTVTLKVRYNGIALTNGTIQLEVKAEGEEVNNEVITKLYFTQSSFSLMTGNLEEFEPDAIIALHLSKYIKCEPENTQNVDLVFTIEQGNDLVRFYDEDMIEPTRRGSGNAVIRVTDKVSGLSDTCTVKVTTLDLVDIYEEIYVPIGAKITTTLSAPAELNVKKWKIVGGDNCINLSTKSFTVKSEGKVEIAGVDSKGNTKKTYIVNVYRPAMTSTSFEGIPGNTINISQILTNIPANELDKFNVAVDKTDYATSDGKTITLVKPNMKIDGKKEKAVKITVKYGEKQLSNLSAELIINIDPNNIPIEKLSFTSSTYNVHAPMQKGTFDLKANLNVVPENANKDNIAYSILSYSPYVEARSISNGVLNIVGFRDITIQATDPKSGLTSTCTINFFLDPYVELEKISFADTSFDMLFFEEHNTMSLLQEVILEPENATADLEFTVINGEEFADISNRGLLTARDEGTITVQVKELNSMKTAQCKVKISQINKEATIQEEHIFVKPGQEKATLELKADSVLGVDNWKAKVIYSSEEGSATINGKKLSVTQKDAGSTYVQVQGFDGDELRKTYNIYVFKPQLVGEYIGKVGDTLNVSSFVSSDYNMDKFTIHSLNQGIAKDSGNGKDVVLKKATEQYTFVEVKYNKNVIGKVKLIVNKNPEVILVEKIEFTTSIIPIYMSMDQIGGWNLSSFLRVTPHEASRNWIEYSGNTDDLSGSIFTPSATGGPITITATDTKTGATATTQVIVLDYDAGEEPYQGIIEIVVGKSHTFEVGSNSKLEIDGTTDTFALKGKTITGKKYGSGYVVERDKATNEVLKRYCIKVNEKSDVQKLEFTPSEITIKENSSVDLSGYLKISPENSNYYIKYIIDSEDQGKGRMAGSTFIPSISEGIVGINAINEYNNKDAHIIINIEKAD